MSDFMHINTKEVVNIVSEEHNCYILNSGVRVDKQLFAQKYAPLTKPVMNATEFMNTPTNIQTNQPKNMVVENNVIQTNNDVIDPINFLNSPSLSSISGLDVIKNVDPSKIVEVPDNMRTQIRNLDSTQGVSQQVNNEEEKRRMLERHNSMINNLTTPNYIDENDEQAVNSMINNMQQPEPVRNVNENGLTEAQETARQNEMELTGVDPFADRIKKYKESRGIINQQPSIPQQPINNSTQQPMQQTQQHIIKQNITQEQQVDPTIALFKTFKRKHKININLKIKDVITDPTFIKMMAANMNGDIIQYYTDEIFAKFLSDMQNIKTDIYNQIHKDVFGCLPDDLVDDTVEEPIVEEPLKEEKKVITLISGTPTKSGERTFKYLDKKGNVVDLTTVVAEKKGFLPATNIPVVEGKERNNIKKSPTTKKT